MTRHIMVVEDEPLIRMDAVSLLETAGLSVMEFDSADEALDHTQTHLEDVMAVFTDINLRGKLDGIDLARAVLKADPTIPVIVTSGRYVSRPSELPEGASFVRKPWIALDILSAMQSAAER